MNIRLMLLLLFILLVTVPGCGAYEDDLNRGLITYEPCPPPCWQGLTPGVSNRQDVDEFLRQLSTHIWPERKENIEGNACIGFFLTDKPGFEVNRSVDLYVYDDRLVWIDSSLASPITLKKIVRQFGDPSYYRAVTATGSDGTYYGVSVYYPSVGLKFDVAIDESRIGNITPEMKVNFVEYYPPGTIEEYFSNKYSCWSDPQMIPASVDKEMRYIQPWLGFGDIHVIETK